MSLGVVKSRALLGIQAPLVTVEAHLSQGLPKFTIVGMPEVAVKESKDRVRSAILTSGFKFPPSRITLNLGPADLPKESGRYDLPIALCILVASGQLAADDLQDYEFAGELALSGALQATSGILPFALQTGKAHKKLIIPVANADEALLAGDLQIYPAVNLNEVHAHLSRIKPLLLYSADQAVIKQAEYKQQQLDLADVRGQAHAKRALEIAAAGGHSLLMKGPPGTGKTLLSSCLPSILPELSYQEALETAALLSISHKGFHASEWKKRPFRTPHHTISTAAMVGGGKPPRPGEISLAHHGVLFLDELPEFQRHVIEALREPLESGTITISRAARQAEFPARFQLVCAMNPCPCGYLTDPTHDCYCSKDQILRYKNRLSGPFLDRIDMHLQVPVLPKGIMTDSHPAAESSEIVRVRVVQAREKQQQRQQSMNAHLVGKMLEKYTVLTTESRIFLENAMQKLNLSARGYHRVLRVSRTIADLNQVENISRNDIAEALSYREID